MNKEQLLNNVRKWIQLDDEIKELGKHLKEKRQDKKNITSLLVDTMKENEIDCFDLAGGNKLIYQKSKLKKTLSKKHLIDAINKYINNTEKAKEMGEFILNSREEQIKENIRRRIPK
tara:strand:+ start:1856 stop:2206 length:351 start_codon:yes stop_codon:yes gene_type:complete